MPTYDYRCEACGERFEILQKISEEPISSCPSCHSPSFQRGYGGGLAVHFKGSGFYETDYKSAKTKSASPTSSSESGTKSSS